ncbi:MAG: DUF2442 domain-containing protein [bacterium]
MPGADISRVELTNVSSHCLWLMIDDEEFALPFDQFPWFRDATIAQLSVIERPAPDHLHWPLLAVDLTVPSIRDPAAWPLVAR